MGLLKRLVGGPGAPAPFAMQTGVLGEQLPAWVTLTPPMKISPGTAIGVVQLQITSRPPRLICK